MMRTRREEARRPRLHHRMDFIVDPSRAVPGGSPVVARVAVPALWHNRTSRLGLWILRWSAVVFVLLLLHDTFGSTRSPLVGVVAYLVTPSVSALGVALVVAGQGKDGGKPGSGGRFRHPGGSLAGQQCYECHNDRFAGVLERSRKQPEPVASPAAAAR